jgi:hypothetical protein
MIRDPSAFEIAWWKLRGEREETFVSGPRPAPLFWDDVDDAEVVGEDEIEIVAA